MLTENSTNLYRLLRPRWYLIPAVLAIMVLVDMVVIPLLMLGFIFLERVGAELKNPFENAPNDTPMTALCRTIERDLRQCLGEEDLPPPIEPKYGILV